MSDLRVFLSYPQQNWDWAESFANALRDSGVAVWLDRWEIHPGDSAIDGIETGLRDADVVVLLLDSDGGTTPNVLFEFGGALALGKPTVAIAPSQRDQADIPFSHALRYLRRRSPEETARELLASLQPVAS